MITLKSSSKVHNDLGKKRMLQDKAAVKSMVNIISNVFANNFEGEELISLSIVLQAMKEVEADLILAKERRTEAMNVFNKERLSKEKSVSFFNTREKLKLNHNV